MGSMVVVHWEDGWPWTHVLGVGKGDYNHNNRSYTICITRRGWLKTRNSKHVKTTITEKQYLWDQFNKNIRTDTVKDILKWLEKQTKHNLMHTHNEQGNKVPTENDNNDTQWDNMQQNSSNKSSQGGILVNNEQKEGRIAVNNAQKDEI